MKNIIEMTDQERALVQNWKLKYEDRTLIHIETWNAAIEASAKLMDDMGEEARITGYVRELKI